MSTYTVALISKTDAEVLAKKTVPQDAFKCRLNNEFYTYEDVAQNNNVVYTPTTIGDAENNAMFIIEWNGTSPVFKQRKMFPR